jgi:hypothetical protein
MGLRVQAQQQIAKVNRSHSYSSDPQKALSPHPIMNTGGPSSPHLTRKSKDVHSSTQEIQFAAQAHVGLMGASRTSDFNEWVSQGT